MRSRRAVLAGLGLAALLTAGGLAYLASPAPDGLDAVSRQGCEQPAPAEAARGDCIASHARESPLAGGPLAGYTVAGRGGLTGLAGIAGVLVTLALGAGLFRVLRRGGERGG